MSGAGEATPGRVRALQVVTLRMLHDAAFRAAVYRDPDRALAGLDLPEGARDWLRAPDPRAWEVDPLRNARLLTTLLEAYPVTGLALAEAGWRLPRLHAFFGAPAFHAGLAAWGVVVDSFHEWLVQEKAPARALAALERAIAEARRDLTTAGAGVGRGTFGVARGVAVVVVDGGTLARYGALRRTLGRLGSSREAEAVAKALSAPVKAQARPPRGASGAADEREGLAVLAGPETSVREVGEGVVALIRWLRRHPATQAEAVAWLVAEGLAPEEAEAFLAGLVEDGLLVA